MSVYSIMGKRIVKLNEIALHGNIEAFYSLIIREDVRILEDIDELPFVNTPLHIAASAGSPEHVQFAMEMMRLKPSFARKLNLNGYSPIHLALQEGHTQMVHQLLQVDGDLVRVKAKEGMTLLHYAAKTDEHLDLLVEFLSVCPHSIEDVTIQNETALHISLKHKKLEAFKLLVGWLRQNRSKNSMFWERKVLNWKDGEGNTVLHIAIFTNQPQAVNHLLASGCDVDVNVKNLEGNTARDILQEQTRVPQVDRLIEVSLRRAGAKRASSLPKVTSNADYLRPKVSLPEKLRIRRSRQKWSISDDKRNALLVVATLLITVTYQGLLDPPEWVKPMAPGKADNETSDGRIYSPKDFSWLFIVLVSTTFMLSYTIISQLIPSGYFYVMFQAALFFLYVSYFASWAAVTTDVTYGLHFLYVLGVTLLLYNIVLRMDFSSWRKRWHKASQ